MELIINTFGVSLNRDNNAFVVTNDDGRKRIPVDGITSIQIGKGVQVTSDAIFLAIENEIQMIFAEKSGMPLGRIWSHKYGSISTIRKGQLEFSSSHDALIWIKDILCKKIENQQGMLLLLSSDDAEIMNLRRKAIARMEEYRNKILALEGELVSDVASTLRGWEGSAAHIYFEALSWFTPEHLHFTGRTQHPAMDPINALLNYGYGILYGKIEGALIKAGIDPYIGILHRDEYNRPVLVYDVIELYRVWVDYVVMSIATQDVVNSDYFSVREDGSYWLENLGRRVIIQSINDYLEEVVIQNGTQRSRAVQIQLYTQALAQKLKKY